MSEFHLALFNNSGVWGAEESLHAKTVVGCWLLVLPVLRHTRAVRCDPECDQKPHLPITDAVRVELRHFPVSAVCSSLMRSVKTAAQGS